MKSRREEYQRRKIKRRKGKEGYKKEKGQVAWAAGIFLLLFLGILLYLQLQIEAYRASAMYLEDALALSDLASAVIDVREYGIRHRVCIADPEEAYERYLEALQENLGLDEQFRTKDVGLISGEVQVLQYIIYNVTGEKVNVWRYTPDRGVEEWQGVLGEVRAPSGQTIEYTGVYSEITYPVKGFLGIVTEARKGKLVDIVPMHPEVPEEKIGETDSAETEDGTR